MRSASMVAALCAFATAMIVAAGPQSSSPAYRPDASTVVLTFDTPEDAANMLVDAAERFDTAALRTMFGPQFDTLVLSGEQAQDRQRAADFAGKAREAMHVSRDASGRRATVLVGDDDWPFPIPLVRRATRWSFDTAAGRREILYRRVGSNELDAIRICRGYVDAQHDYALKKREGYDVAQYAQRIISTPGKQDGLAWQNADGTWDGPVGEKVAHAIGEGYSSRAEPYHGYLFKVLKGQGPAAPLGQLDYVINGAMIGGFALVASPAQYGVTGVKTFIVSQDGVVYEKDFGTATPDVFARMERFNPDRSWKPVAEPD